MRNVSFYFISITMDTVLDEISFGLHYTISGTVS